MDISTADKVDTEISLKEREICDYVYNWFIKDPGLMDWKKRGRLRDLIDEWCILLDEYEKDNA